MQSMNDLPEAFQPLEPATCWFQGMELTAGLPLAATVGRLTDKSPCPEGACQRLEANYVPWPRRGDPGTLRHPNPGIRPRPREK